MRAGTCVLTVALTLAGCGRARAPRADTSQSPEAATPADTSWVAKPTGIGPVRIGMTVLEAHAALTGSTKLDNLPVQECAYLAAPSPHRVFFMAERDTVVRYDVRDSSVKTAEGVGIGDSEARLDSVYTGRITSAPDKYTGPVGHDLTVPSRTDTLFRLVFETDGKRVTTFHAGRLPAVAYVEGCG